jgi:polar amino acid transport system substrate-binding protein
LCLTIQELEKIKLAVDTHRLPKTSGKHLTEEEESKPETRNPKTETSNTSPLLMVGYNRRFSPHIQKVKESFSSNSPLAVNYRINAGTVPQDHWVHDPDVGGGRIIGEVCHFIDLAMFIAGSGISSVFANNMRDVEDLSDTLNISLKFNNGSIASISYFSVGDKRLPKEYLEVFCNGQVAIIDDFKKMTLYGKTKSKSNLTTQNKGQRNELKQFFNALRNGTACPVLFEDSFLTSLATFAVLESINKHKSIDLQAFYRDVKMPENESIQ